MITNCTLVRLLARVYWIDIPLCRLTRIPVSRVAVVIVVAPIAIFALEFTLAERPARLAEALSVLVATADLALTVL